MNVPASPAAVTADEVIGWFREYCERSRHRRRRGIPKPEDVRRLAGMINELRGRREQRHDPVCLQRTSIGLEKWREAQKATDVLLRTLPDLLELLADEGRPTPPPNPVGRLSEIGRRADLALALPVMRRLAAHLGEPLSQPGRHQSMTAIWTQALWRSVCAVWRAAGRQRLSIKPDGPVVAVLCRALHAIDREEHTPEAVAATLKRLRQKGGGISA